MFVIRHSKSKSTNIFQLIDESGADRFLQNTGSVNILDEMERIEDDIRKVDATNDPDLATQIKWRYFKSHILGDIRKIMVMLTLHRKKKLFIEARNKRVEEGLKKKYKNDQEDLKVFCVSNLFYGECCGQDSGPRTQEKRSISGIPTLRMFCYSTLVDPRLEEAKNFILTTLPSALASISLRSQSLEIGPTCSIGKIVSKINYTKMKVC